MRRLPYHKTVSGAPFMRIAHEWAPTSEPNPSHLSRPNHPHPPRTARAEGPTHTSPARRAGSSPPQNPRAEGPTHKPSEDVQFMRLGMGGLQPPNPHSHPKAAPT